MNKETERVLVDACSRYRVYNGSRVYAVRSTIRDLGLLAAQFTSTPVEVLE